MVKIQKRSCVLINDKNYIAATATVATIWPAKWFEFFTVNRDATIAATAGGCMESYTINESCHLTSPLLRKFFSLVNKNAGPLVAGPQKINRGLGDYRYGNDVYNFATASATESNFACR
jgi:hypothetical protein